jgi:HPt (histidine-containing phosphotransfer) domain-containing protein
MPMEPAQQESIVEAMNRLWAQYLPQIEERVQTLEQAAAAHESGTATQSDCEQAMAAAHKLAGVLGTFGLPEGSVLAREMEALYAAGLAVLNGSNGRPKEVASQLRAMLATRK